MGRVVPLATLIVLLAELTSVCFCTSEWLFARLSCCPDNSFIRGYLALWVLEREAVTCMYVAYIREFGVDAVTCMYVICWLVE